MSIWLKAAGKWGSVFAILALIITLLKQIIGFIAFLTTAIKILVVLSFILLFVGVGFVVLRSWNTKRTAKE
jgi:positive regulator of sigma E activity